MAADTTPRSPFDDADADIIIRSSDDVHFHLYKVILAKASPIFKDMFSFPATPESSTPPVVPVTEDADTLERLPRFCYPVSRSAFADLEQFVAVAEAARKYQMTEIQAYLEQDLQALVDKGKDPLRIYAIAYLYHFRGVLDGSVKSLLNLSNYLEPATMPPEFLHLSAAALYALIDYRRKCVRLAIARVDDLDWMVHGDHEKKMCFWPTGKPILGKSWTWISCREQPALSCTKVAGGTELSMKLWITEYLDSARQAVRDCPTGKSVTSPSVLAKALESASTCSRCMKTAWKDLVDYSHLLAARIDDAVAEVELELPA
ncbi:hypothetical protein BV20DRAFT_1049397 [Pilatotrama ljubarskyi]|nr:hypothetical protein BV20DRAFT_1049397 [Pilatotrama ljubarskyi]